MKERIRTCFVQRSGTVSPMCLPACIFLHIKIEGLTVLSDVAMRYVLSQTRITEKPAGKHAFLAGFFFVMFS